MNQPTEDEVARCLRELEAGDESAMARLLPHVYEDLRKLAGGLFRGRENQTLQPTALVHEAYLRLVRSDRKDWTGRRHFLDVAAMAMRQLLSNYAEARRTAKRGGDRDRVMLQDDLAITRSGDSQIDLVALDEALTELTRLHPRQARIVELRFLSGLSIDETAEVLGVSRRTVNLDWRMAQSWLGEKLDSSPGES